MKGHSPIISYLFLSSLFMAMSVHAQSMQSDSTKKTPVIIVGGIKPPYEFKDDNGQICGFQVDLMQALMQKLDIPYEYRIMEWNDAVLALEKGEADMTAGIMYSPQRETHLLYGVATNYAYLCIISTDDGYSWTQNDLSGKRIVVVKNGRAKEWLKEVKIKDSTVILVDDLYEGLRMVDRGIADVMVGNNIISQFYINKHHLKLSIHNLKIQPDKYCMAFKLGNDDLMLKINSELKRLKLDGTYDKIYDKWFSIYTERKIPAWIYYTVAIGTFILFLFIVILKIRVNQATSKIKEQNDCIQSTNKQLSLILHNTDSGYMFLSPEKDIIWENFSVCKSLDYPTLYKDLNTKCYEHIPNPELCAKCPINTSIKTNKIEKISTLSPLGRPIEITSIPVFDAKGSLDGYILKVDDITKFSNVLNEAIEARNKAEQSDQLKSAFLANMSHEIRTPLNAIVGFSELLVTEADQSREEQQECQHLIEHNSQLLLNIVNEVLDLSRIEAGYLSINKTDFDLNLLFQDVATSVQTQMQKIPDVKLNLSLICSECTVSLDKVRTEQLLLNFLTNAIKYTEKGSITAGYVPKEGQIKLFVKDTGTGIPQEKIASVFDRFHKLNEFKQGIGLGLAICKGIVNAFGGTIGVDSEEGKGSIFWALIPCEFKIKK